MERRDRFALTEPRDGWRFRRNVMLLVSILLTLATVAILILVLLWKWQIGDYYVWIGPYAYSGIGWHWGIALGLAPLFILHVWQRWPRPKKVDFTGRRQALKLMGFGAAALVSWGIAETLAKSIESTGAQRRFTGSREEGSFAGNDHPVTTAPDQGKIKLDPDTWSLQLTGAVTTPIKLAYEEILDLPTSEVTATLDCTGGWYTVQTWRGVRLKDLLSQAELRPEAKGIILRGVARLHRAFHSCPGRRNPVSHTCQWRGPEPRAWLSPPSRRPFETRLALGKMADGD